MAVGDSEDDLVLAAAGLYMLLELLNLFCKALNFSFPFSESISSKESFDEEGLIGGVAAILQK